MTERLEIPNPRRGNGPYTPPPLGGEARLYALLAVEIEPGHIFYYHVELDHEPGACTIDIDRNTEDIHVGEYLDPIRRLDLGPIHITATLSGTVVSDRPDYRPPTRAQQPPPGSIGDNALTGYTRALPGPHHEGPR